MHRQNPIPTIHCSLRTAALLLVSATLLSAVPVPIDVGPQTGTFDNGGAVRGFWFTAPVDFWIHGVFVPEDASADPQTVEIVRFNSGSPPFESGDDTNDFTSLFRAVGVAGSDPIDTPDIRVLEGQWIGVLGYRGTTTSYGDAPYFSSILGQEVILNRLGVNSNFRDSPAGRVFTDGFPSIGRIELIVDSSPSAAVPEPSTISLLGLGAVFLFAKRRFSKR